MENVNAAGYNPQSPVCICPFASERFSTRAGLSKKQQLWLLTHPAEVSKSTNTGVVVQLAMQRTNCRIVQWKGDSALRAEFTPEMAPILIYPLKYATKRGCKRFATLRSGLDDALSSGKMPVFIIIDSTWEQSKEIYASSATLQALGVAELPLSDMGEKSQFRLRRGQKAREFCTAETAACLLRTIGEVEIANDILGLFKVYQDIVFAFKESASLPVSREMQMLLSSEKNG
eukprot:jgi/Bigna1/64656/fgenesh1_kg.81_\